MQVINKHHEYSLEKGNLAASSDAPLSARTGDPQGDGGLPSVRHREVPLGRGALGVFPCGDPWGTPLRVEIKALLGPYEALMGDKHRGQLGQRSPLRLPDAAVGHAELYCIAYCIIL